MLFRSGLDNIMLGSENLRGLRREKARAEQKIEKIMLRSGLKVPLGISVGQLTVGEQQRIEILKALYRDVKILVLDEPTAVLSPQEADLLFHNLSLMTRNGLSVIFISHKLREVLSFSQRIVILRHGKKVGELVTSEADERKIANLMVGSNKKPVSREVIKPGKIVLELQNLSVQGSSRRESLEKINLSVREHEIIGIAGISGNGQKALAGAISGMTQPNSGSINLNSKTISNIQPSIMIEAGIGRIPDDRHRDGIVGQMTVTENLLLENISSSAFSVLEF